MNINWFPGHMRKTGKILEENIKFVNLSIVVLDARAPLSTINPLVENIVKIKPVLYVLNKIDLADKEISTKWIELFKKSGKNIIACSANGVKSKKIVIDACNSLNIDNLKIGQRGVRALITGVPNVGKSTLINTLAGTERAKTGDRPAITTNLQRIFVQEGFELYDTPGILWHKFEDQEIGYRLAIIGSIKDEVLNIVDIALRAVDYFKKFYLAELLKRFNLKDVDDQSESIDILGAICLKRGAIAKKGVIDYEKGAKIFLQDVRGNKICPFTLDRDLDVDFSNNSCLQ